MKTYVIPYPYDYHEQGEFVVQAKSEKEAIDKILWHLLNTDEDMFKDDDWYIDRYLSKLDVSKLRELTEEVYVNEGCDC